MLVRSWLLLAVLAAFLMPGGALTPALASDHPIVKYEGEAELELNLGMILDDLVPPLIQIIEAEDEIPPGAARTFLDLLGISALDRLNLTSSSDSQRHLTKLTVTLDSSKDGGLLGSLMAVPPGEMRFGQYLRDEDIVLLFSALQVNKRIETLADFLGRPEIRKMAPMIPPDPLAITAPYGIDLRRDILAEMTGELDMILFPLAEGQSPEVPGMAMVLGLKDGPAFREKLIQIATNIAGEEHVSRFTSIEGETVGDYTFYPIWEGISYAIGPDFGIVTTDSARMKRIVTRKGGGLPVFTGHNYLRANGDLLLDMVNSALSMEAGNDPEAAIILDALRKAASEPVGMIEIKAVTGPGRAEVELFESASILPAVYRVVRDVVQAVPKIVEMEQRRNELRAVVFEVDEALTRYGQDHDATFPESLEALVAAGYLGAVPDLRPTPLGQFVDGGYTYLPLKDDAGTIVGHYLFVYGGNPGGGFDVFTEANLADPANFKVGRDGKNDGVASFAYDGIALGHMEDW
jgi:hypothetical protein